MYSAPRFALNWLAAARNPGRARRVACASARAVVALALVGAVASCGDPTSARSAGAPASIAIVSGDAQRGTVGEPLPSALTVIVRDSIGTAVPNEPVVFWYT